MGGCVCVNIYSVYIYNINIYRLVYTRTVVYCNIIILCGNKL